ncbi:iron-containing alcohol dehydrogenase [Fomitopsis serialis]|uniref:iron-containing alcohol dehydrogenase n=1 Tax=Fomitopsis serialis TaxID=139415 RepID=UPI002008B71E|nr:iron-containing alcohol dehydrogenase [Neoantrodia serialis]KAH9914025.1 iron-containing alcohol dehydrogenase [Neoantrodia serialis]
MSYQLTNLDGNVDGDYTVDVMCTLSSVDLFSTTSTNLQGQYAWTDTLKGVHYGPGSLTTALPKLLKTLGASKALVVTGRSLYDKTDVVKKVEGVLKQHNAYAATFYEIGQHSPVAGIHDGLKVFKESGADVIVSVGGGSPVDASKAILYFLQQETGGEYLRQIAIGAGYTNEEGKKVAVSSPQLAPAGIILDAELTLATPERLWLSTGMRAVDHAVENLYRPLIPPPVKYLAMLRSSTSSSTSRLEGEPSGVDNRYDSALGLSHALGHKLGATYSIPHGITSRMSVLTLAPTVALKAEVASEDDKEWLSNTLWYLAQDKTGSLDGDVLKLSKLIDNLVSDLGLKSTLSEYNVPREDLPKIAELSVGSKDDPTYPKVVKLLEGLYAYPSTI